MIDFSKGIAHAIDLLLLARNVEFGTLNGKEILEANWGDLLQITRQQQ